MNSQDDGGPAFPVPNDANVNDQEGMTLRDYFAAKAMAAMLSSYPCPALGVDLDMDAIANDAYAAAYSMVKARKS